MQQRLPTYDRQTHRHHRRRPEIILRSLFSYDSNKLFSYDNNKLLLYDNNNSEHKSGA
jgi:hypothetical protein